MPFQRKKPEAFGTKVPFPGFIAPALATSIGKAPGGERWIHEIKFDGYRVQVHLANETIKVFTRNGHDWILAVNVARQECFAIGIDRHDGEYLVRGRRAELGRQHHVE